MSRSRRVIPVSLPQCFTHFDTYDVHGAEPHDVCWHRPLDERNEQLSRATFSVLAMMGKVQNPIENTLFGLPE